MILNLWRRRVQLLAIVATSAALGGCALSLRNPDIAHLYVKR